jgi:hypothetical protein
MIGVLSFGCPRRLEAFQVLIELLLSFGTSSYELNGVTAAARLTDPSILQDDVFAMYAEYTRQLDMA